MGCFSSGSTKVKQQPTLTRGQRSLLDQLTELLGSQLGQGITPYQGQMVAPASSLESQAFNYFGNIFPTAQNMLNYDPRQGQGYLNQGSQALNTMLADYDPASARNYWNEAVKMPAMQTWQKDIVPQIMEKYAGQNAADSGAMRRAIANSAADMNTNLNAQLANLIYSGEQAQLGRQQQGINQAMQMSQMPGQLYAQQGQIAGIGGDLANQAMNAGFTNRSIEQQVLDSLYNRWATSQAYNNPWLQNYLGIALDTPAFTNVAAQQPMGLGSAMMLGGLQTLGNYFGAMSDRRLKENVIPAENALNKVKKLKAYFYNFKGQDEKELGLMAQDVQKVAPEAVYEQDGILMVKPYAVLSLLVDAINELSHKLEK